jgi:hypothetical protein
MRIDNQQILFGEGNVANYSFLEWEIHDGSIGYKYDSGCCEKLGIFQ